MVRGDLLKTLQQRQRLPPSVRSKAQSTGLQRKFVVVSGEGRHLCATNKVHYWQLKRTGKSDGQNTFQEVFNKEATGEPAVIQYAEEELDISTESPTKE